MTGDYAVIKLGGEVVSGPHMGTLAADVAELSDEGTRIIIVHGGGPQATALQKALGQTPNIVAGRRITDAETLDVMKMVVAGKVNVDLCSALLAKGARPVGLHGASSNIIRAKKRAPHIVSGGGPEPIDFGHVGDVVGVNRELLALLSDAGYVPVVACLGADSSGAIFNINADVVANHLVRLARHLSIETQHVAGVQLIVQGAIKLGLMAGPLRVADPMTLVGLTVFIG